MYTVYILHLKGVKRIYIGVTSDFDRRLREHEAGKVKSTRKLIEKVLHTESFEGKKEAWKREKWFKSSVGRNWIHKNLT